MSNPLTRLAVLRAAESLCLERGVDALSLAALAIAMGEGRAAVSRFFHDETTLLDALLERHQTPYEQAWEERLEAIDSPRAALRLLASSIAAVVHVEDGGAAYVAVAAQMCTSARFPLTARPSTTTPAALKLMGKLTEKSEVPFSLMPLRFERFAAVLFSSVLSWYRHGAARVPDAVFVEDLVDTLEAIALAPPSPATQRVIAG